MQEMRIRMKGLTLRREIARMNKALCRRRRQRKRLDEKVAKLKSDLVFWHDGHYKEVEPVNSGEWF